MALKFLSVEFFLPNVGEIFVEMQRAEYQGALFHLSVPSPLPFSSPPLMSVFFISCPSSVLICHIVAIKH